MTGGFENLGFSREKLGIFKGLYAADTAQGSFAFPCAALHGFRFTGTERLYLDGTRILTSGFFWTFLPDGDCNVARVFLFSSATDAMAFYQIRDAAFFRNAVVYAIGPCPAHDVVETLKSMHPVARFSLCFPNDVMGRIRDVIVASSLERTAVSVRSAGEEYVFRVRGKEVPLRAGHVSLSRFEKVSGLHLSARTEKPKGQRSFFELVRAGKMSGAGG